MSVVILARVTASNTNQGTSASATPALKEWAAIVHALLEGEQIVDVRKGGIHEDGRHFDVSTTRCWLSPTAEHQKAELLKPAYAHWVDLADASPVGQPITVQGWADIVDVATITEPEHLDALDSKLVWARDYVESRFTWKRRDPLWVLVLRVHRLAEPLTVAVERRRTAAARRGSTTTGSPTIRRHSRARSCSPTSRSRPSTRASARHSRAECLRTAARRLTVADSREWSGAGGSRGCAPRRASAVRSR